jgi:release factor glutamine methyltransferase
VTGTPASLPDARLVARLRAAGCVFAEEEAALLREGSSTPAALEAHVVRRVAGEPLEQILGWAELDGRRVVLEPGVFVPRRRTALLVREAARRAPAGAVAVDLCCGSGAVGAALGARVPGLRLYAADVDPAAVRCARRNLPDAVVLAGDLFAPLPAVLASTVDVVVVCPPYVPSAAIVLMASEARDHEPRLALDGGADGLDVVRRIAADAPRWLRPGGLLLLETSQRQVAGVVAALTEARLVPEVVEDADLGAVVVVGTRG